MTCFVVVKGTVQGHCQTGPRSPVTSEEGEQQRLSSTEKSPCSSVDSTGHLNGEGTLWQGGGQMDETLEKQE